MRTLLLTLVLLSTSSLYAQGNICSVKTDYDPLITCSDEVEVVHNLSELSDYQQDFGASTGFYKHLKIDFNISDYSIDIHSPCSILVSKEKKLNSITNLCIDAKMGLTFEKEGKITAQAVEITSQDSSVLLQKSFTVNAQSLKATAKHSLIVQKESHLTLNGPILLSSTGNSVNSFITIEQEAKLNAASLEASSLREIHIQKAVKLTSSGIIKLLSTGNLSSNNIVIQKEAKIDAQSFSMKAYALVSLGQEAKLTVQNDAEMISTGSESFSQALVDKSAKVVATNFKLNSGKKAELGKESKITASSIFEMDAPECLIRQDATYTAAQKVGRCIGSAIPNQLPIAIAGVNQAINLNQLVNLDGSSSYDLDGDKLSYTWSITSKPTSSTSILTSPNTPFPTINIDQAGSYVLNLVVSDGKGNSLPSSVTLSTLNVAPIAIAPRDQSITLGTQISLDGSNSYDPNNDSLTYSWSIVQKPSTSTAQIIDANQAISHITPDASGDYVISLVVNDASLSSQVKTFTLSTNNTRPVAQITGSDIAYKNQNITLDASGSFDDENSPLTYKWALLYSPSGSTPIISGNNSSSLSFTSAKSGKYVLSLIVNDGNLNSIASNHVIHVQNQLPNAVITSSSSTVVLSGSTINLSAASSSDPDGDPITYAWSITSKPTGSSAVLTSTNSQTTNVITDLSGNYLIKLIVSDSEGSSESQVTFRANLPPTPSFTISNDIKKGRSVTFDASNSSDPELDNITYSWSLLSKPADSIAAIGGANLKLSSLIPDKEGTYTISLIAKDDFFESAPVIQSFTLNPIINNAPTLNSLSNITITLGDEVHFTLTATDAESDFIQYKVAPDTILASGMVLDGLTGKFSWHPELNQTGNFTLNFIASDGKLNSTQQSITIIVNPVPAGLPTVFKGVVRDSHSSVEEGIELPIVGATVSIVDTNIVTTTNEFGEFILEGIPDLETTIFKIDSSTAIAPPTGGRYANFIELIHLIDGTTNIQPRPFYLPRVNSASITQVEPNKPTQVLNPEIGVEVNVPANAAMNPDGTPFTGEFSVSMVPANLAPVTMPPNIDPGMLITLQPSGIHFDQDVAITYPNIDNLPVGAEVNIMQMNDKLGVFEIVGTGRVTSDGKRIETISGGLRNTSWGLLGLILTPADPLTDKAHNNSSKSNLITCGNSIIDNRSLSLIQDYKLNGHKSLGQTRALSLVYESREARGTFVNEIRQPVRLKAEFYEVRAIIDGVEQASALGFDPSQIEANGPDILMPVLVDTTTLSSGLHKYDARVTSVLTASRFGKNLSEDFPNMKIAVNKRDQSPFGHGWTLSELQRVYIDNDGDIAWFFNGDDYLIYKKQANGTYLAPTGHYEKVEVIDSKIRITNKDKTIYRFDAQGRILSIVDRNKNETSYLYDQNFDRVVHIQDPSGKRFLFNYDASNLLTTITDAGGRVWNFEFDSERNLTKITEPSLNFYQYRYGENHLMSSKLDTNLNLTQYELNDYAQVEKVISPDGKVESFDSVLNFSKNPIPASRISKKLIRPRNLNGLIISSLQYVTEKRCNSYSRKDHSIVFCFDFTIYKNVQSEITPSNLTKIKNYDANGNLAIDIDETNRGSRYFYDQKGNLERYTNYLDARATVQMSYDSTFNQLTSIKDMNGNKTDINLDSKGNAQSILDPKGNRTDLKYNSRGQVTFITDHNRQTTQLVYSELDGNLVKVVDPLGNITQMSYDNLGNVSTISDPSSKTTQFFYNEMNLVTKTIGADLKETNFEYDAKGNLTKVIDSRNGVTTFSYDQKDRVLSRIDPLGNSEGFTYDEGGNLISKTDRLGQVTYFEYDLDSRLVKKLLPDSTLIQFNYDAAGRVLAINNGLNSVEYTYDEAGRVKTTKTIGDNTPTVTLTNAYDVAGNRTGVTGPMGQVNYEFDSLNRIKKLTDSNSLVYEILYDKLGRRAELVLPNNTKTTYGYDKNSQLTNLSHSDQVKNLFVYGFQYDSSGNRTQMTTQRDGITNLNSTLTYGYDDIYQVISATNPISSNQAESFVYDDLGNRLTRDGETFSAIYDLNNRLIENQDYQFSYDSRGSLISKVNKSTGEIQILTWDSEGQLVKIEWRSSVMSPVNKTVNYVYDVLGRRIEKDVNGTITRYVYDSEDIVAEFDGNNNLVASYSHGPEIDEPLAMKKGSNQYYLHSDALGSIVGLTNSSGQVLQHYVYDSFGRVSVLDNTGTQYALNQAPIQQPYGYTGRELDPESEYYYYRARYYDPSTGRFISEDPIGLDGEDVNYYRMVNNNPINSFDPDGLAGLPARARVGGGGSYLFAGDFGGGGGAALLPILYGIGVILHPGYPEKGDNLTYAKGGKSRPLTDPEKQLQKLLDEINNPSISKEERKKLQRKYKQLKKTIDKFEGEANKSKRSGESSGPCDK